MAAHVFINKQTYIFRYWRVLCETEVKSYNNQAKNKYKYCHGYPEFDFFTTSPKMVHSFGFQLSSDNEYFYPKFIKSNAKIEQIAIWASRIVPMQRITLILLFPFMVISKS